LTDRISCQLNKDGLREAWLAWVSLVEQLKQMADRNVVPADAQSLPSADDLRSALKHGDLASVRSLIEAGAPVQYRQPKGYNALIDAAYSVEVDRNPDLLGILKLLVDHGVELSGVTDYGESALRVLSGLGRFDAVRYLLDAGADRSQLEWSPLHEAVAMGSLADVQTALAAGESIEERDWWSHTAFHLSLLVGDLEKASLLRDHGADQHACGRCGASPMFFAVRGRHPEAIRWLIQHGHNIDQVDDVGETALVEAVQQDDLACVNILLDAGANIYHEANAKAIDSANSREVIMRLLDAGANPANISHAGQRIILGLGQTDVELLGMASQDDFCRASTRSLGMTNPERMSFRFWEAMIRSGVSAYHARQRFAATVESARAPI
jgi:ankyrin repeat protein